MEMYKIDLIYYTVYYVIPFSVVVTVFILFTIKVFNKKDKSIKKPFYRLLNWLPIGTIPIYEVIFEGDHSFKLIPVFIIILYEILYQSKLLNTSEVVTSMVIYVFWNFIIWSFSGVVLF